MNTKKLAKRIENAELKFQQEQLKAAMMEEQLQKAIVVIEGYKDELAPEVYEEAMGKIAERRNDIQNFIMAARDKYARKLKELGDPTLDFGLEDEDLL